MIDTNKRLEQQLILDNMGAIVAQALKFKPNSVCDLDDYKQEGAIALLKAIRKYKPEKGKLTTYAWKAIWRAIARVNKKFNSDKNISYDDINNKIEPVYAEPNQEFLESMPELTQEEFTIIMMRLYGHTLEEIGNVFNKHKESIRIEIQSIINKIKKSNKI